MTRVKICGITHWDDACCVVEAGADAIGFVFYGKSPRNISIKTAAKICYKLPPFISKVGVFVNEEEETIKKTMNECGLDVLQFHGDESPDFCRKFMPKVMKAFRLHKREDGGQLTNYKVNAWLLDAYSEKLRGGTGKLFDWEWAVEAKKLGYPIILSGGLTSENVAAAIKKVQPFAVDVSSGVESSPGKKDPAKIRKFLRAVCEIK